MWMYHLYHTQPETGEMSMYICVAYRIRQKAWQKCKNQFGKIKFGENVKILIIVVELQNVW